MRGLKGSGNYWVMETTAGPRGGGDASAMLDKGEMRAAIWDYIGHGADLVSYWQWRDALNGGEANHGAIVDVDGTPDPIYTGVCAGRGGVREGGSRDRRHGWHAAGRSSAFVSKPLDHQLAKDEPGIRPGQELMSYYTPLHQFGYSVDIVPPDRDLTSTSWSSRLGDGAHAVGGRQSDPLREAGRTPGSRRSARHER